MGVTTDLQRTYNGGIYCMEIIVKNKKYNLDYTSVIGVNYTYETEFQTTILEDTQKLSYTSIHVRIAWAIVKTDNPVVECTFDEFRKSIGDKGWIEILAFISKRTAELKPVIQPEGGEESKND